MANRILKFMDRPFPPSHYPPRKPIVMRTRSRSFNRYQRIIDCRIERLTRNAFLAGLAIATAMYVLLSEVGK